MSINQNFPEVSPSLLLDFANSRTLDPRITFERASIGTYVDENGLVKTAAADEARFDHDANGNCLGLLIEEQRTNIALNSEDFSTRSATTYGTKSSVTTNATIAPDGTQTADLVTTVTTTTQNRLGNLHAVTSGQYYTYSVYVKQGNKSNVSFYLGYTALINASMSFTFATETLSAGGGTYLSGSAGFDKLDNGWYRVYFTGQGFGSGNTYSGFISDTVANETFYIWGEQIEVGTFPTSYIPTSGSTFTRQPDTAKITGTNFTDFYNQTEGSIFWNGIPNQLEDGCQGYHFDNGTSNNRHFMRPDSGNPQISYTFSGTNRILSVPAFGEKIAYAYKSNDYGASQDGVLYPITSSSSVPSGLIQLGIGYRADNNDSHMNGHIKQLLYYPQRLTDSQLQNLTK